MLNRCNNFSVVIIVLCLCLTPNIVFAKSTPPTFNLSKLDKIKAGFLLHFTSFVQWPNADNSLVNLCIVGKDPFGMFIDAMVNAKPNNRQGKKIVLTRIPVGSDVAFCQLIFITQHSAIKEFWNSLPDDHSILLVSGYENFSRIGGIVNFYEDNKRVRIAINLAEARKHQLFISSELLKIVKITSDER